MKYQILRRSFVSFACVAVVAVGALAMQGCNNQDAADSTAPSFDPSKAAAATPPPSFSQTDVSNAQKGNEAAQQASKEFQDYVKTHPGK